MPVSKMRFTNAGNIDVTNDVMQALHSAVRALMSDHVASHGCHSHLLTPAVHANAQFPDADKLLAQTEARWTAFATAQRATEFARAQVFCSESTGARDMAGAWGVPYLGSIPMDPELTRAAENGLALPAQALASPAIAAIVGKITAQVSGS